MTRQFSDREQSGRRPFPDVFVRKPLESLRHFEVVQLQNLQVGLKHQPLLGAGYRAARQDLESPAKLTTTRCAKGPKRSALPTPQAAPARCAAVPGKSAPRASRRATPCAAGTEPRCRR